MDTSIKIKLNVDTKLMKELEQFRYDPYHLIVSNRVEDTLGYYEQELLTKKAAEVFSIKESDLGMTYNPFYEIGTDRYKSLAGMLREPHPAQMVQFKKETVKKETPMITLTLTSIQPEAINVLHAIGSFGLRIDAGKIKLTLEDGPYKQFNTQGIIFTIGGRALDPSFGALTLRDARYIMKRYEKVQHDGAEIDTHVVRRDGHYVVFPSGTTEVGGWTGDEYTLPGGVVMVIDTHGYLYMKTQTFTRGDDVIVTIQGEEIEGTYDQPLMGGIACLIDLETEDEEGKPAEYVKVLSSRVRHA